MQSGGKVVPALFLIASKPNRAAGTRFPVQKGQRLDQVAEIGNPLRFVLPDAVAKRVPPPDQPIRVRFDCW